jgi:N-acetyl-anhydromuramyl-L-alanine amidase AmpD
VDPKAYPIKILADDFTDKNPDPEDQSKVKWTLKIGHLEPHTTIRGITQRLANYGFHCPIVKVEDDKTKAAVSAYQVVLKLKKKGEETGKIADIRDDIKKRHDQL